MTIQDLRIGNYLRDTLTGIERPATFQTLEAINYGRGIYEPIPLTSEWLVRMGFEKAILGRNEYFFIDDFEIEIHDDKFPLRIYGGESAPHLTQYVGHRTKYIHQLQNLYYALTGQELIIKP